jgi:hypothetical protein
LSQNCKFFSQFLNCSWQTRCLKNRPATVHTYSMCTYICS